VPNSGRAIIGLEIRSKSMSPEMELIRAHRSRCGVNGSNNEIVVRVMSNKTQFSG
jgi:hypothetical protein